MRLADALLADDFDFDFLPGSELGDENVIMERLGQRDALTLEPCLLIADWHPHQVTAVDVGVIEVLLFVFCVVEDHWGTGNFLRAFYMQLKPNAILAVIRLALLFELERSWIDGNRHKT